MQMINTNKGSTLKILLLVLALVLILSAVVFKNINYQPGGHDRDLVRLSDIKHIKFLLEIYFDQYDQYPSCLVKVGGCLTSLEELESIGSIPKDPLTRLDYSYAANG